MRVGFFLVLLLAVCFAGVVRAAKKSSNVTFVQVDDLEFENNGTTIKNWDRVLDVRGVPPLDYVIGHLPGAVHLSEQALRGPYDGRLPFQLWPADLLAREFSAAGVSDGGKDGSSVLVYSDGANVLGATLAAYALEKSGVPRIGVLDGGFASFNASSAAKGKITKAFPKYKQTKFEPKTVDGLSITLDEILQLLPRVGKASNGSESSKEKAVVIVDPRPRALYEGTNDTTFIRPGHIPGAINLPWQLVTEAENPNATGGKNPHKLKPEAELRKLFESRGVTPDKTVVVSCSTGRESTLQYLVLKHVLNYPDVRIYEGSWAEWSAAEKTPAEVGPDRSTSQAGAVSS